MGKKEEETKPPEEEAEEDLGEEPPKVELDEEDEKINFIKPTVKDLTDQALNSTFGFFSIPEKSEGFDEIKFEWQNAAKSTAYLKTWRQQKKITSTIHDLVPGEWFKTKLAKFKLSMEEYQNSQKAYK